MTELTLLDRIRDSLLGGETVAAEAIDATKIRLHPKRDIEDPCRSFVVRLDGQAFEVLVREAHMDDTGRYS